MFHLTKQQKLNITIKNFHCLDYFYDFNTMLDKFNLGLFEHTPIVLNLNMKKHFYFIICNLNEIYILDMNNFNFDIQKISLQEICNQIYNDLFKQQNEILELLQDNEKEHFVLSLQWLNILLNQEDFKYNKKNINKITLDALNDTIKNNTINCIYDTLENIETFRIFSNNKNFLILNTYKKKKCKTEFIILDENIIDISNIVIKELENKRKLKSTYDNMKLLKNNLQEVCL